MSQYHYSFYSILQQYYYSFGSSDLSGLVVRPSYPYRPQPTRRTTGFPTSVQLVSN